MQDTPFAVVTGASSGIGLHLATQFAEHGYDLVVCAEDERIHTAAEELGAGGRLVTGVRADLATPEGVEELVGAVTSTGRVVDALALNAGVGVGGRFLDGRLDDHLRLIRLNVDSVVHLAHRLLPAMVARGSGAVLVTSSVGATMPGPFYATYAASKAFVQSFADALRYELKDSGVTVTTLMPGPTDTEYFTRAGMETAPAARGHQSDPVDVARAAFDGLVAGEEHVIPGLQAKTMVGMSKTLPGKAQAAVHGRMSKPADA